MASWATIAGLLGLLAWSAPAAHADDALYESARFTLPGQTTGYSLAANQLLGVRFQVTTPWRITRLGGHLFEAGGATGLFVAVVPLDGPDDLPDTTDLSDAVWGTSFHGPPQSADVLVNAGLVLEPGWYGMVLGGGLFGSDGSGGLVAFSPELGRPSWFRQIGGAWQDGGSPGKRFVIRGYRPCDPNDTYTDTAAPYISCEEDCFDGFDNDLDGWVDCQDETCWHLLSCCDADGDGFQRADALCGGADCDDHPATGTTFFPGAIEPPADGIDQDCDGVEACYVDADGDGFGAAATALAPGMTCAGLPGLAAVGGDCDDTPGAGAAIHPGAVEIPGDNVDSDCDRRELCYRDDDGDGWGGAALALAWGPTCAGTAQLTAVGGDCNDRDALVRPGAPEIPGDGIDQDCDGGDACYRDEDADGFGVLPLVPVAAGCEGVPFVASIGGDCRDSGPRAFAYSPAAFDVPQNGEDEDCDGIDACYPDADGDGYGGEGSVPGVLGRPGGSCSGPGRAVIGGDCDDTPGAWQVRPGALEVPGDGIDQDCDGVDACYLDQDLDGWGGAVVPVGPGMSCARAGYAAVGGDCVDAGPGAALVSPGAAEIVGDGIDQDCSGADACWVDLDGDGYGGPGLVEASAGACGTAPRQALLGGDCDDGDPRRHPGVTEVVGDGVDQDCDGLDGCYRDRDDDRFGTDEILPAGPSGCAPRSGLALVRGDCDDAEAFVHPGAWEWAYDGVDQDCDGADLVDVDRDGELWVGAGGGDCNDLDASVGPGRPELPDGRDNDCDGQVDEGTTRFDADGDGFSPEGGDCDDTDPSRAPSRLESCNGADDDCDGEIDEGTLCFDDDYDGFSEAQGDCHDGDPNIRPGAVEVPANGVDDDCDGLLVGEDGDLDGDGFTEAGGDCDPTNPATRPGALERADGVDNDCDGVVDEGTGFADDDGDGFRANSGDCNDADPAAYPGAPEVIGDGRDQDCDGFDRPVDAFADLDGDGFVAAEDDCDDTRADVHPFAVEVADGVDNDCDGVVDEDVDDRDGDGVTRADGDCDDEDGWQAPGLEEVCDFRDNDCDGLVDEGCHDGAGLEPEVGCVTAAGSGAAAGEGARGTAGGLAGLILLTIRRRSR